MSYFKTIKFQDQNGVSQPAFIIDGLQGVIPYYYLIADGKIPNHSAFNKFGFNPDVDNTEMTNTPFAAGLYVFPTAGMGMEIVSSSANDAAAGTGARTVKLSYLDANYVAKTEIITLNGLTAVPTVALDILRVNSMQVQTVGSGLVAAGNISIRHLTTSPTYGQISAGFLSMRQLVYTVPAGSSMYLNKIAISSVSNSGGASVIWRLRLSMDRLGTRTTDGRMFTHYTIGTQDGSHSEDTIIPFTIPEKIDMRLDVVSDAANANAVCTSWLQGWLETSA